MPTLHVGRAGSNPTGARFAIQEREKKPGLASLAESVDAVHSKCAAHRA